MQKTLDSGKLLGERILNHKDGLNSFVHKHVIQIAFGILVYQGWWQLSLNQAIDHSHVPTRAGSRAVVARLIRA